MNKVFSLFAGIGGICKAFENAGFNVVGANEIDKKACETYRINHPHIKLIEGDIKTLEIEEEFDVLTGGFPCQSFSLAGNKKGLKDDRGSLFFNIANILQQHSPSAFLLENVKNILSSNNGEDFQIIEKTLTSLGYKLSYKVLSPHKFCNVRQNRERIFIVGSKDKTFTFPEGEELTRSLDFFLERNKKQEEKFYYKPLSQYYSMLNESITNNNIFQLRRVYVRENKNQLCPTLTANMGTGGHNVPIIRDEFGLRKLTPKECANFQGFYDLKWNCSNSNIYKQIGNSVCVPLVKKIALEMRKQLFNKENMEEE